MDYFEKDANYIMHTYARFPVVFEKGEGMYLIDTNGKKYLDFVGGIAVNALGAGNKKLAEKIAEQAQKLIHCSNLYLTKPQLELAELLVNNSCMDKAFFCNSGAEAVEGALKLSRKYGSANGKNKIIAMKNSFHGRTYGAITATGQDKYHYGFEPLLPMIEHIPFNDFKALSEAVCDTTCAVILEPVQGEGGIIPADKDYLTAVRELCTEKDIILIFDEVQCGVGRIGSLFAYEYFGVEPDIVAMAKGLAGGVPIGAMLAKEKFAKVFVPGNHASTFGGNPLAAACACVVISEVKELLDNVRKQGDYLRGKLMELKENHKNILDVRGVGFMQGIELSEPVRPIIDKCLEKGLLLLSSGEKVIRFVPPLIAGKQDIDDMCAVLNGCL